MCCEMITTIKLLKASITSHNSFCVCVCVMKEFEIIFSWHFEVYIIQYYQLQLPCHTLGLQNSSTFYQKICSFLSICPLFPLNRQMVWKYFLPLFRSLFHFVDCFLYCKETSLMQSHQLLLLLLSVPVVIKSKKTFSRPMTRSFPQCFPLGHLQIQVSHLNV